MNELKALDRQYIANTYARSDVLFTHGKGSLLYDDAGKEYIDMGSGIAVNTFGIGDEAWENAVTVQAKQLQHISNLYYTSPQIRLAELLCEKSGMKKVFFGNSGAEANECAIKAARKYSNNKYTPAAGRNGIVTLKNSFHGRTLTTLSATGQEAFHQHFFPFTEGFVFAEPDDIPGMKALVESRRVCAIMIELIQGEGGIHTLSKEYVAALAQMAQEKDILLIVDEVQTGNGRTGSLYAYMEYGITPDIITTAKGLGGGLPIGACLFGEKTQHVLDAGSHGSTFGGNPVCCAGALSILERLDEDLLAEVQNKSDYIIRKLTSCKKVQSISGMGLMLGIACEKDSKALAAACLSRGVVALTAKNKLRLLPALNIPMPVLQKAVRIIKEEIEK
ncbi:MAG: acetylornithine/succinylornithine family transaminase [Oscillospiraceae bacterium]|jgi:acetylornithine/N-succinyldiaminopimelate aminotransferase|nr:acetylornithine/succinylornithine family transaminase [Oscillospiraceae bacterium]